MKKKVLIMGIVGLMGTALGFQNCAQKEDFTPSGEISVDQNILRAQRFFETKAGSLSLPDTYYKKSDGESGTRSADIRSMLAGTIEPDWANARVFESGEFTITEVPAVLSRPVTYTVIIKENGKTVSNNKQAPHTRIRIVERLDIDTMYCFLITMLPDKSYKDDPWQLAADPEGSKFTGITLYSQPDGTPAWGWRYKKGEVTHTLHFDATEQEPDPDISVSMGIDTGAATRGSEKTIEIGEVLCTAPDPRDKGPKYNYVWIGGIIYILGPPQIIPDDGGGGGGGGGGSPTKPKLTVSVPNNYCVVGSIAAALQAKHGLSATEARRKAEDALRANGIEPVVPSGQFGLTMTMNQWANTLRSLGFVILGDFNSVTSIVSSHFNSGGWAIGIIPGGVGHSILLTGYNQYTDTYHYYDATVPGTGTIPNRDVNDLLIK